MRDHPCKPIDPRVRRTRQLLHDALARLLETRDFEMLSVQDITDAATLNRATFYDHFPDKESLLRCLVAGRFHAMLEARGVRFDGTGGTAFSAIALGVCDYLASLPAHGCGRPALDPQLESAVITVVRGMILDGLARHGSRIAPAMVATTVSWAIYGGAKEWFETPERPPSEEAAATIAELLIPVLATLEDPSAAR